MVTAMLDVHRMEHAALKLEARPHDLSQIARDVAADLSWTLRSVGATISVMAPNPIVAPCDAELLRRVLANLLDNAAKSAPEGEIVVEVSATPTVAVVVVRDNGAGIPAEHHEHIFAKFGRVQGSSRKSIGLGLAFCRMAIEAHGGRISVTSSEGDGAAFRFEIPVATDR